MLILIFDITVTLYGIGNEVWYKICQCYYPRIKLFLSIAHLCIKCKRLLFEENMDPTPHHLIDRASLSEKSARKMIKRSYGNLQFRSFGYQINRKQNSAEIMTFM